MGILPSIHPCSFALKFRSLQISLWSSPHPACFWKRFEATKSDETEKPTIIADGTLLFEESIFLEDCKKDVDPKL